MRGKPTLCRVPLLTHRNIPAYAGKTMATVGNNIPRPEHPRVCGENLERGLFIIHTSGTSPRMRGKLCSCSPIR